MKRAMARGGRFLPSRTLRTPCVGSLQTVVFRVRARIFVNLASNCASRAIALLGFLILLRIVVAVGRGHSWIWFRGASLISSHVAVLEDHCGIRREVKRAAGGTETWKRQRCRRPCPNPSRRRSKCLPRRILGPWRAQQEPRHRRHRGGERSST